ncbi:hypothetical protein GOV12_05805 [Candidatus Pacearchaeota archaeon]|nr:hypothetical protein [Candidatus Pacearchaeota archaeon]
MKKSKIKALVYMNEDDLDDSRTSGSYLIKTIRENFPERFDLKVTSKPDVDIASDYDVIISRFNPVRLDFLKRLNIYDDGSRLFVNPPKTQMKYADKTHLRSVNGGVIPVTYIGSDPFAIATFMKSLRIVGKDVLVKPVIGYGGQGVRRLGLNGESVTQLEMLANDLTDYGRNEFVVQEYLDGIERCGDKRIHVLFGESVTPILRFPKKGYVCNLASGGTGVKSELDSEDRRILNGIMPFLRRNGIVWAGVDIMGSSSGRKYLGEVNLAAPGALIDTDEIYGNDYCVNTLIRKIMENRYDN